MLDGRSGVNWKEKLKVFLPIAFCLLSNLWISFVWWTNIFLV